MNENKLNINWFPGHMTKSMREVEENIKKIDVAICVLDARAPYSCLNPELESKLKNKTIIYLINKVDLADPRKTNLWLKYFKSRGDIAETIDATKKSSKQTALDCIYKALANKMNKQKNKQIFLKNRVAIVGVPNTGKSTLLNTLAGAYLSKTGNIAGVTRGSSWIKIKNNIELMDNAGTLYPKFFDQNIANNLAFIGSISDSVLDTTELALSLIEKLKNCAPEKLVERYLVNVNELSEMKIFESIAKNRGFVLKGNEIDYDRCGKAILDDFRKCRIGRITLEVPTESYVK